MPDLTILHVYMPEGTELGSKRRTHEGSEKTSSGSEKNAEKKSIRHDFFIYSLHAVPGRGPRGERLASCLMLCAALVNFSALFLFGCAVAAGSVVKGSCFYFQYIDMSNSKVLTQEVADTKRDDIIYKE